MPLPIARNKRKVLTREQEVWLAKRIERGDLEAKNELVSANLRLVIKALTNRKGTSNEHDVMDLIQNGNIGLIRAAEKFDWRRGFKFSTYAMRWIRQGMDRGFQKEGTTVAIPIHQLQAYKLIKKEESRYIARNGGAQPSLEELAELTGMKGPAEVQAVLDIQLFLNATSLDKPISEGNDSTIGDAVRDRDVDIEELVISGISAEGVNAIIGTLLDKNEQVIIRKRYGLGEDPEPVILEDIAKEFGCTRERIRQIQLEAEKKLKQALLEINP